MSPNFENKFNYFESEFKKAHFMENECQASETRQFIDGYLDKTLVTNVPKGTSLPWYASADILAFLDLA